MTISINRIKKSASEYKKKIDEAEQKVRNEEFQKTGYNVRQIMVGSGDKKAELNVAYKKLKKNKDEDGNFKPYIVNYSKAYIKEEEIAQRNILLTKLKMRMKSSEYVSKHYKKYKKINREEIESEIKELNGLMENEDTRLEETEYNQRKDKIERKIPKPCIKVTFDWYDNKGFRYRVADRIHDGMTDEQLKKELNRPEYGKYDFAHVMSLHRWDDVEKEKDTMCVVMRFYSWVDKELNVNSNNETDGVNDVNGE